MSARAAAAESEGNQPQLKNDDLTRRLRRRRRALCARISCIRANGAHNIRCNFDVIPRSTLFMASENSFRTACESARVSITTFAERFMVPRMRTPCLRTCVCILLGGASRASRAAMRCVCVGCMTKCTYGGHSRRRRRCCCCCSPGHIITSKIFMCARESTRVPSDTHTYTHACIYFMYS